MLLCDAAQVADGKLYILGGGWSMTGPDPVPSAVALKIDVDWHEAEIPHHWELFLEDADGSRSWSRRPTGRSRSRCEGISPSPTRPGFRRARRSTWRSPSTGPHPARRGDTLRLALTIDGESLANASLGFTTRPRRPMRERAAASRGRWAETDEARELSA